MILAIKLLLTPLLIVLITLAARRWGYGVAGWLAGLPTTSGPILLILTLQHGATFAAHAALGTLGGLVATIGFCIAYARSAERWGPAASLLAGFATYAAVVVALRGLSLSVWMTLLFVLAAIFTALTVVPRRPPPSSLGSAWWDLPARIGAAILFVLVLTGLSTWLGPSMSGLLSPFPLFTSILAAFAHRQGGRDATIGFIRGALTGGFSFVAFTLVVITRLEADGLVTFLLASVAALAVNGVTYMVTGMGSVRAVAVAETASQPPSS